MEPKVELHNAKGFSDQMQTKTGLERPIIFWSSLCVPLRWSNIYCSPLDGTGEDLADLYQPLSKPT